MIAAGIIRGPGTIKIAKIPEEINDKARCSAINSTLEKLTNKNKKKIEYIIKIPVGYLFSINVRLILSFINPPVFILIINI